MLSQLIRKVVLKDRSLFVFLNLALFLLSFVFLLTYFVINSLQQVHLKTIRDIVSYDIRIDESLASKEEIENIKYIDGAYLTSELEIFSPDSNSVLKLRFVSPELFSTKRFDSQFIFFSPPVDLNTATFSSSSTISPFKDYYYIKKSSSSRAIIGQLDIIPNSYFYSKSPVLNDVGFMDIKYAKELGLDCYWGLYVNNMKLAKRTLDNMGIKYTTFRDFSTTLTTALAVERYMFILALFFIFAVLVILFYRLAVKFINENRKNISALVFLGMREREVFAVFSLPMGIIAFISAFLGCIFAYMFSSSQSLKRTIFMAIFSQDLRLSLQPSVTFGVIYMLLCAISLFSFSSILYLRAKKFSEVDFYE